MVKTSFLSDDEIEALGFRCVGQDVRISRKASIYSPELMTLGNHVRIDDFCIVSGSVCLGNYVHIGAYSALFGAEGIEMADYSGLSSRVSIYTVSDEYVGHGMTNPTVPMALRRPKKGRVRLERHVIIGAGTIVLPGVTIGEGAAVGALSLVGGSVAAWKIASGIPAKPRADRKRDQIEAFAKQLENR